MLTKTLCVRFTNYYRLPLAATNIYDCNSISFNKRKSRISIIGVNTRLYHLNHQIDYINKSPQKQFLPIQHILRNKTTSTTTTPNKEHILGNKIITTSEEHILGNKIVTTTTGAKDEAKKYVTQEAIAQEVFITPLTTGQKFKKAIKEYGSVVIVFHVGISLISLGTCYLLVTSGLDITKVFALLGLEDWINKSKVATNAGSFAIAYAVHKIFAPVRMGITLASVPLIVKYLRKIGFLKK